jgi:hypothetical protein
MSDLLRRTPDREKRKKNPWSSDKFVSSADRHGLETCTARFNSPARSLRSPGELGGRRHPFPYCAAPPWRLLLWLERSARASRARDGSMAVPPSQVASEGRVVKCKRRAERSKCERPEARSSTLSSRASARVEHLRRPADSARSAPESPSEWRAKTDERGQTVAPDLVAH